MKKIKYLLLSYLFLLQIGCAEDFLGPGGETLPDCEMMDFVATIKVADAFDVQPNRSQTGLCLNVPFRDYNSATDIYVWLTTFQKITMNEQGSGNKYAIRLKVEANDCIIPDATMMITSKIAEYDFRPDQNTDHKRLSNGLGGGEYSMKIRVPKNRRYKITAEFMDLCTNCPSSSSSCGGSSTGRMKEKAENSFTGFETSHKFNLKFDSWMCQTASTQICF